MDGTPGSGAHTVSSTHLYGSAIAVVSGLYSVYLSLTGTGMGANTWFMLALGLLVLVHGLVLLTPLARRFPASGPLMIGYGVLMLADQAWLAVRGGSSDAMASTMGMGWDAGMIALALLMLVSGLVMATRSR